MSKHYDPLQILARADELGITLQVVNGEIKLLAAKGVVTQKVLQVIKDYKAALIQLLTPLCCICFSEALPNDHQGDYYCVAHHPGHQAPQPDAPVDGIITTVKGIQGLARHIITGTYVFDLETTGLDPRQHKIVSLALGAASQQVHIIDMRPYYHLSPAEQAMWREAVQALFHPEGVIWAGHNLKFDLSFLAIQCGVQLRTVRCYDTMLVERLIHAGHRVSAAMQATAERYSLTVTKEERAWFPDLDKRQQEWRAPFPQEQLDYIRQDITIPHAILTQQQITIQQRDLARVVALEHEALPTITAMEVQGVLVHVEQWRAVLAAKQARLKELEEQIQQVLSEAIAAQQACTQHVLFTGKPFVPRVDLSSNLELLEGLQALGIKITSINKETLEASKDKHAIIPVMLEWRQLQKFVSSFGETLLSYVQEDGRIHATFDQLGAASGRIICQKPNLQQIPKSNDADGDIRRCFVAPAEHTLLIADLSNIELRILADVSRDATMLRFFAEGKDLHAETARLMFRLSPETDTKKHLVNGVKARDIAKTINFGLAYGMGAQGLASRVGCTVEAAKDLMKAYFATYKGVDAYLKASGRNGITNGYAVSLSGRRRNFSKDELGDYTGRGEAERSAKNHPIQATNADILKRALALLYKRLPGEVHIVMTIHDEIVLECPGAQQEEASQVLKTCMQQACTDFLKRVAIPEPDVLVSDYWLKG